MVAGGNMKGSREKDSYCGFFKIETVMKYFFVVHISNLEVYNSDVGNDYLHGSTKKNIYKVSDTESGEW